MIVSFRMNVEKTFMVGGKIIFAGTIQSEGVGERKGLVHLLIDGQKTSEFQIEGEVFDNKPERSLWAYVTPELCGLQLSGHEVIIASV
jgi:hypothetical protein